MITRNVLQGEAEKGIDISAILKDSWIKRLSDEHKLYLRLYFVKFQNKTHAPEQISYLVTWISSLSDEIKSKGFVNFISGFEHRYTSKELKAMYAAWYL